MRFVFYQYDDEPVYGSEIDIVSHMKGLFGWTEWPQKLHDALLALRVNGYAIHDDLSLIVTRLA